MHHCHPVSIDQMLPCDEQSRTWIQDCGDVMPISYVWYRMYHGIHSIRNTFYTEYILYHTYIRDVPTHRDIHSKQLIADRVAQNLEITSENSQFRTRRTRIFMGFISSTMLLRGTNRKSHRQSYGSFKHFRDYLKISCHHICNRVQVSCRR